MDKINQIKKEIFTSMKMMDITIKGIKESEEYKIAQAYNQGLRDAMAIFEREMKRWFTKIFEGGNAMDSSFFWEKMLYNNIWLFIRVYEGKKRWFKSYI